MDGDALGSPVTPVGLPVARVAVDTPLPHLDRPFDYLVPDGVDCPPGCRVRVRFAGRLVDGYVLDRVATSEVGKLATLKVVSPEVVLTPAVAALARTVADRYAGSLADVLRLAVPPRHARAEAAKPPDIQQPQGFSTELDAYVGGRRFLDALAAGRSPRAVWAALPGSTWPGEVAAAARATAASGRGALVLVPDARDVARVRAALPEALALQAGEGPEARYRRFLAVARGRARIVVGTRAAAFAPVRDLGLVMVWDDGDDLYAEPRAPYPHTREVALLRCLAEDCALLLGGHAVTAEGASLVESGWAHPLRADRDTVRRVQPRVLPAGSDAELARDEAARTARLPTLAWRTARDALRDGPVLVQVPRRGYVPGLACQRCRAAARCSHCGGPLGLPAPQAIPACRWCARPAADWRCAECGYDRLRAGAVGERRTAEELGRAFPGVPVRTSGGQTVLDEVPDEPAIVVCTPGAEPAPRDAAGRAVSYAAVLLLDAWTLLNRPDLRAGEEALRRWANAAALARPGAPVVLVADGSLSQVQALVRWDPFGAAGRELADRAELGFPPAVRMAAVDAEPLVLQGFLDVCRLPASAELLGPVPLAEGERMLVRVPRSDGAALAHALHDAAGVRSAKKEPGSVRVQVDPAALG